MSNYKQLTYELRCQIYVLNKTGTTQQAMADAVGVNQATISRELKRNTGGNGYRFAQAKRKTEARRAQASNATKMTPSVVALVESKLRDKLSPEQISDWLLVEECELLSHETIYVISGLIRLLAVTFTANYAAEVKSISRAERVGGSRSHQEPCQH